MDGGGGGLVMGSTVLRAVVLIQFAGVLGICFNHLSITLLRFSPPAFSDTVYAEPARWGVAALFLTSGFLLHWRAPVLMPESAPVIGSIATFLVRRFLWLAIPALAAMLVDMMVLSFKDFGPSHDLLNVAPLLLSLSQTWIYDTIGHVSIGQPMNTSNMAWISSCLFLFSIVYAILHRLVDRMSFGAAFAAVLLCCAAHLIGFSVLEHHMPDIIGYGQSVYGDRLAGAYTLAAWATFYSPYAHLMPFLAGVSLAQIAATTHGRHSIPLALLVLAGGSLMMLGQFPGIRYLGVNVILLTAIIWWTIERPQRSADLIDSLAARRAPHLQSSVLDKLGLSAYALLLFHMIFYFPLQHRGGISSFYGLFWIYVSIRAIMVTAMVALFSYGFIANVALPLRRAVLRRLALDDTDDKFI